MKTFASIKSCILVTVLVAAAVSCGKSPAEKPTLQGRWSGLEAGSTENIVLEFVGDKFAYWDSKTNEIGGGTFTVNETATPMQMDLTFERIIAPEYVGKVGLAVYQLRGNTLTIAGAEPGSTERPASVAGGTGIRIFTFTRQ